MPLDRRDTINSSIKRPNVLLNQKKRSQFRTATTRDSKLIQQRKTTKNNENDIYELTCLTITLSRKLGEKWQLMKYKNIWTPNGWATLLEKQNP